MCQSCQCGARQKVQVKLPFSFNLVWTQVRSAIKPARSFDQETALGYSAST